MPSPLATLLRVLLSIILVLNGPGYAVAATQMAQANVAQDASPVAKREVARPCHEHDMAAMQADAPVAIDVGAAKPGHPAPDCCKSGKCVCASTQPASLTLAALSLRETEIDRTINLPTLLIGHISPLLAHPIRPPIS